MANKKTTKATAEVTQKPIETNDTLAQENAELKETIAAMKAQMELLAQQIIKPVEAPAKKKEKMVQFVNLTRGSVVLKGTQFWKIEGQFNARLFSEREARIIVNNMGNAIRSGLVYINDAEFVEENELGEAYATMLSDNDLRELLNKNYTYVIDAYKMVSDEQKKIIVDMIVQKREQGEMVDGNVLMELGKLCGRDLVSIEKDD